MRVRFLFFDALGNVAGELDDFVKFAIDIKNRVIGCFQPDDPAMFADTFELVTDELAVVQFAPELGVFWAVDQCRFTERSMVLTLDLGQRITHDVQEVVVGGDHIAVGFEFADSHRPIDSGELAVGFVLQHHACGDVQSVLDHLDYVALRIDYRVVTGFEPDAVAVLADALEGARDKFPGLQGRPEISVLAAAEHFRFAEVAMRLACQFFGPIAHRREEVIVGTKYFAIETQLDHRHRFFQRACQSVESIYLGLHGRQLSFVLISEHNVPLGVFADLL